MSRRDPDLVRACPECESADIGARTYTRTVDGLEPVTDAERYLCRNCGATFPEPIERPEKSTLTGVGRRLEELDAERFDEYVTDGGEDLPLFVEEAVWIDDVDLAVGARCAFRYPGIGVRCSTDADVVLTYAGENVYETPTRVPFCREHVTLPDAIWDDLAGETEELATDGGRPGKTRTIDGYLVVDWKKEQIRARKTEPNQSELGTNELIADLKVTVTVPEIPVPEVAAAFEVPEPMVESAIAEAIDNRSFADWERTAESVIADRIDEIEEAANGDLDGVINGITVATLRAARGRPDIDEVERYVNAAVAEIREGSA